MENLLTKGGIMRQSRIRKGQWSLKVAGFAVLTLVMLAPAWAQAQDEKGNVVFFRGGWVGLNSDRGGEVFTDVGGTTGRNNGSSGYYVGGGVDLLLSKNLWGMLDKVWAVGEIGVEFKRFDTNRVRSATNALTGLGTTTSETQITMLTVDIAPKIKFMEGSRLRPWIIPIGLDFHVISPPGPNAGYLDVGIQFGAGAEYQLWKELKVGVDGRYHLASNQTSTVNNFGTVGAYVGIGF
jgi:opacity protein-like surface antigen